LAGIIESIADTALWVAAHRANESERRDALFLDPYARDLAGPRGEEIVRRLRWARDSAWAVVVRTAVLDEMLLHCVRREGTDCVLNLAAGLDTRPYRLDVPRGLRWIEVDLQATIDHKERRLATEQPRCELERVPLDLADTEARAVLLDRVDEGRGDTLVLCEGLLVYLASDQVAALSDDLAARPRLRRWLLDLAGPVVLERIYRGGLRRDLEAGGAPMRFAPEEGPDFFRPQGWRAAEIRHAWDEARRLGREPAQLSRIHGTTTSSQRQPYREIARYVLLERERATPDRPAE
jgi:methyltransferase (TIGR00027 family)